MKQIRDVQTIIGLLENGNLAPELSRELTKALIELRDMVASRPKSKVKGKVTLTLGLEVEASTVSITAGIESKLPKQPREANFYWITPEGALSTEHPQQMNMFGGPREIEAEAERIAG
jgi:hypothetical protein